MSRSPSCAAGASAVRVCQRSQRFRGPHPSRLGVRLALWSWGPLSAAQLQRGHWEGATLGSQHVSTDSLRAACACTGTPRALPELPESSA